MTSESPARNTDRSHRSGAPSRLLRDIKADWRRWSGFERATATMVAVLSAFVPLYLVLTLTQAH
jgi:hypothetical protein